LLINVGSILSISVFLQGKTFFQCTAYVDHSTDRQKLKIVRFYQIRQLMPLGAMLNNFVIFSATINSCLELDTGTPCTNQMTENNDLKES